MGHRHLRVLLIEDDPGDALLVERELKGARSSFRLEVFDTLGAGLQRLDEQPFDVLLLDLRVPDGRGIDSLQTVRSRSAEVPVVVFTTTEDYATAIRALREGAQEFLVKGEANGAQLRRALLCAVERRAIEREREAPETVAELQMPGGGAAHDVELRAWLRVSRLRGPSMPAVRLHHADGCPAGEGVGFCLCPFVGVEVLLQPGEKSPSRHSSKVHVLSRFRSLSPVRSRS